jgi:hypothetical protein
MLIRGRCRIAGRLASISIADFLYLIRRDALRYRQLGRALFAIRGISRRLRLRSIESKP